MGNRLSLRAMPIIAFARKFAFIFMLICSFNFNSIVFGAKSIHNSFNFETWSPTTFNEYANAVMGTTDLDYYSKGASNSKFVNSMGSMYYKVMRNKNGNLFYGSEYGRLSISYNGSDGFYTPWMNYFTFNSTDLTMSATRDLYDMKLKFADSGLDNFDSYYSLNYLKTAVPEFYPVISGNVYSDTFNAYVNEIDFEPNSTDSIYGYLWSPSVALGNVEVNKLYDKNNQIIHCENFIGSALQYNYNFYYYSGDDIVSVNNYISDNSYADENYYGLWHTFYIEPQNLQYLPNNTDFYLNIYVTLGNETATVIENFLAFHTVEKKIIIPDSGNTGNITNESGDVTGTVDLSGIQNSLGNIENKIPTSGDMQGIISNETNKVINFMSGDADFNKEYTSGEILEKIDFTPIENPTANFWYELTQILNNALTGSSGNVVFKWFGNEYSITPEMIIPPYPEELRVLLTTVSTVVVIFIIAKWIKIIADTSQGGNLDQLLEMNEEGIVNLF